MDEQAETVERGRAAEGVRTAQVERGEGDGEGASEAWQGSGETVAVAPRTSVLRPGGRSGGTWTREQALEMAHRPRKARTLWARVMEQLDDAQAKGDQPSWSSHARTINAVLSDPSSDHYAAVLKLASERWDPATKYVHKEGVEARITLHSERMSGVAQGDPSGAVQLSSTPPPPAPSLPPSSTLSSTVPTALLHAPSEEMSGLLSGPISSTAASLEGRVAALEAGQQEMLLLLRGLARK